MRCNFIDFRNFMIRSASGIVLFVIVMAACLNYENKIPFYALTICAASCMLNEWYNITHSHSIYLAIGLVAIPIPIASIITIYDRYMYVIFYYLIFIATMDTFAMIGGKLLGGPKLAPKISPNKKMTKSKYSYK